MSTDRCVDEEDVARLHHGILLCQQKEWHNAIWSITDQPALSYQVKSVQFISVQSLSCVQLFVTPWIAARQASLSVTNSGNLLKLTSIESVMPSSHLILCRPLFLLPSIPPRIRVFSNESTVRMRWPKYWSFSFSIIPSKEHPRLISFRMDWLVRERQISYDITNSWNLIFKNDTN